jgi:hypothetical protein
LLERFDPMARESSPVIGSWQRVDRFVPVLPSAGKPTDLLLASRNVHQCADGGLEPLAFDEARQRFGIALSFHRFAPLSE